MFQFLIGTVLQMKNKEKYAKEIVFQFLIGTVLHERNDE